MNVGNGLLGGGSYGDVSVGLIMALCSTVFLPNVQPDLLFVTILANGTVECELDNDGGGDVTSLTVGNGLTGGGDVGDISVYQYFVHTTSSTTRM